MNQDLLDIIPVEFSFVKILQAGTPAEYFNSVPQMESLQNNIQAAVEEARQITVISGTSLDEGSFYVRNFNQLKKKIEDLRLATTRPIGNLKGDIDNYFKSLISLFSQEQSRLESEVQTYAEKLEKEEEERRKKEQKEADDAALDFAEKMGDDDIKIEQTVEIKTRTLKDMNSSGVNLKVNKEWKLVDFKKLVDYSLQYPELNLIQVNEKAIGAMRRSSGANDASPFPGIEYFTSKSLYKGR